MSDDPLVSVVTSFLNEERFLGEAVESVITQTYENWELLLVDDGSSDSSSAIASSYAVADSRIKYLEHEAHENLGVSASRNLGIARASGEFVSFLDADDVWLPDTMEREVALIREHPAAAMVYGSAEWWNSWNRENGEPDRIDGVASRLPISDIVLEPPRVVPVFLSDGRAVPCPSSITVRRSVLEQCGGFEDDFRRVIDDQVLYMKICLEWPVFPSTQCFSRYRQHEGQSCWQALRDGTMESYRAKYLDWVACYMSDRGFRGTDAWHALLRAAASQGLVIAMQQLEGSSHFMRARR